MKAIRDGLRTARFLAGLPAFLRRRMDLDQARAIIRRRMSEREQNFLGLLQRGVFESRRSPYRALFGVAGCELGDVADGVRRDGIERTLDALRAAGVYVTFEEFKGRAPIVRGGREIPVGPDAFDNPLLGRSYTAATGGSTGARRPVAIDLDHLWARVPGQLVADTIQGFMGAPTAIWFDGLPGNAPNSLLTRVAFDNVAERWFSPTAVPGARPALKFRLTERAIFSVARLSGVRLPAAEPLPLDQAAVLARWAGETLERHGRCGIKTLMSRALRVCLAAEKMGLDLTGLRITGGGEPATPAKAEAVARTGARLVSNYHFQEAGAIGLMCEAAAEPADQHLLLDHLAMITGPRRVPGFDLTVEAFCFTTLLPSARKLMVNVETDDYGIVETRDCGCPWEEFGFKTHLREIRSFRKLTGEGVTLVGNEMVRILENVLPARFGGSPLDYQLQEEEDESGLTRLSIVVSPRVELDDEGAVVHVVLEALRDGGHAGAISRAIWSQAGTLRVRRREPTWTRSGKLLPLHLERQRVRSSPASEARR